MTNKTKLTAEMVRKGENQELYEEYAKKKSQNYEDNLIKCELAGYGYCHDILCNDPMTNVREHVICADIRYAPRCFDDTHVLWQHIASELTDSDWLKTPDILPIYDWFLHLDLEQLNITLSHFNKTQYEVINLLYQAETTEPTTIEKTMTPSQLYLHGSPYWIKCVQWPFSATIIQSTKSKEETANLIDIMLCD